MKNNFFFIIGAQRCGTTFLYHLLDEHSEICMNKPVNPEPKFFINLSEFKKGKHHYISTYFKHCNSLLKGEKSTSYIEYNEALKRIKDFFPEANILVILRNPADRAISNYFFSYKNGFETRSLKEVFIENQENPYTGKQLSVSPFKYIERGEYIRYIKNIFACFKKSQVKILIYEYLTSKIEYLASIYEFLGVDQNYKPNAFNRVINASEQNGSISEEIYNSLKRHFLTYNKELENYLNINLDIWK